MNERYDDFDRALLRAGKKAAAPTSRMRARALGAAAAAGAAGAATAAATTKAAAATKLGALAKATKVILAAKWTMVAAVTTASVGTAVYVVETRAEKNEPAVTMPASTATAPPARSPSPAHSPSPSPSLSLPPPPPVAAPKPVALAKPAPVAPASASAMASAKPIDALREELALVEDARRALASGDRASALRHVDEHARRFPSGAFAVEREVLRRRIAKTTETNP